MNIVDLPASDDKMHRSHSLVYSTQRRRWLTRRMKVAGQNPGSDRISICVSHTVIVCHITLLLFDTSLRSKNPELARRVERHASLVTEMGR